MVFLHVAVLNPRPSTHGAPALPIGLHCAYKIFCFLLIIIIIFITYLSHRHSSNSIADTLNGTNCQLIEDILRYHKEGFDAPKMLVTRKDKFLKDFFFVCLTTGTQGSAFKRRLVHLAFIKTLNWCCLFCPIKNESEKHLWKVRK